MKRVLVPLLVALSLIGIVAWQLLWAQSVNYYIVSVAILVLSMMPFFITFELRDMSSRDVALVATMIALAVVSRAVFYLIPQVKPIAAVVIVAGVCLGAERGYVVGAFSAFISNFIFGQGYWTPFQMVALGLVGFIAGLVYKRVKANRYSLAVIGFLLSFAVYGLIVDLSTIIMTYGSHATIEGAMTIYGAGVPFSAVFGASTAVFLFIFGVPFITKVNRVICKYDIIKSKESC